MKRLLILSICLLFIGILYQCQQEIEVTAERTYLNHNDTVNYVGIDACKQCHYDKFESFIRTGMGSSFGIADTAKSIAKLSENSQLYDEYLNLHYHPIWMGDSLVLKEFRLNATDTSFLLQKTINYVVGSGQHTNSHLFEENGYLHQAPFTWYAQEGTLDFPPGYEKGYNSRFNRIIGLECSSCHNAMPTGFVKGSENKYDNIPSAINCERCHGPGEAHIHKIQSGDITDTSKFIDYSIVNPNKLNVELQFQICQRCHLQGNTVLKEEKSFFDFKPGMKLNEIMDVYLPRFTDSQDNFIMASHVDRFKSSKCFKKSEGYTCTSCHNPHLSVKETNTVKFNNKCVSCHNSSEHILCSGNDGHNLAEKQNCVKCHMPSSGSIDIPHVTVHDHFVRKNYEVADTTGIRRFLGLISPNNDNPSRRSKILAYIQQFERFNQEVYFLDSAYQLLKEYDPKFAKLNLWIHYFHVKGDIESVVQLVDNKGIDAVVEFLSKTTYDNKHAWTAYRIGEAYSVKGNSGFALKFYVKANALAPFVPDFNNKKGSTLMKLNRFDEALKLFKSLVKEAPSFKEGLNNLGYCYLKTGNMELAQAYFQQALNQDPDYKLAWLNLANTYLISSDQNKLKKALTEVLRIDPEHQMARQLMQRL